MKSNGSIIIMGFLVVGLWYTIGYIQGAEVFNGELERVYKEGLEDGAKSTSPEE